MAKRFGSRFTQRAAAWLADMQEAAPEVRNADGSEAADVQVKAAQSSKTEHEAPVVLCSHIQPGAQ